MFMSLDCGSDSVEDAISSQMLLSASLLGREACALAEFVFKNDIVVGLCTTQTKALPKYVTTLDDMECTLAFEEGTQMLDVKKSMGQVENWLGMPVQV